MDNFNIDKNDPILFAVYPMYIYSVLIITVFFPILAVRVVENGFDTLFKGSDMIMLIFSIAFQYLLNYNFHVNLKATSTSIILVTPFRFWNKVKIIEKLAVEKLEVRESTMGRFDSKNVNFTYGDTRVSVDMQWLSSGDWEKTVEFLEKNFKPVFERYVNGVKW
ncbi:MAG: hypothetical protein IT270_20380 [Saprospiraceae bacterium]|nr:hypothetical protein [Saprospiraceae bacterium]